jgi:hypothetical protein
MNLLSFSGARAAAVLKAGMAVMAAMLCMALSHPAAAQTVSGRVVGIYVELAPGVMSERTAALAGADRPAYVEVRTAAQEAQPSRLVLVNMNGMAADVGDSVEISLGEKGRGRLTGPLPAPPRLVRVEARSDTLVAQHLHSGLF